MPIKQLTSATFDATRLAAEFVNIDRAIPEGAITKPMDGELAGAYAFVGPSNIRLVLQYQIKTDTWAARFDVLMETPDA